MALQRCKFKWKGSNPRDPPSPPLSNTPGKEVSSSPVLAKNLECLQSGGKNNRKRKRSQDIEDSDFQEKSDEKRAQISLPDCGVGGIKHSSEYNLEHVTPIECWAKTGRWPKSIFPNMSQQSARKRPSSTTSYSQGVKEGIYPIAHTSRYEKEILEPARISLYQQIGEAAIGQDARELCRTLLTANYEVPINSLFEGDLFWKVINALRNEGEGRVVRDLQPVLIPSAEILSFRGLLEGNYLKETVKIPWNNVVSLAGPKPCPDLTVGLLPSAFTETEISKLQTRYNTASTPSRFTDDLYFPFLTCEAKCGMNGLNESDRQNARSAATVINAILQLYQLGERESEESGAVSRTSLLHREILFFSVSHDHTIVKIFAHYPYLKENKTFFYRNLIRSFDLTDCDGSNRWVSYNFIRKLYDHFAPIHLQRIRDGISNLYERESEPVTSTDTAGKENESEPLVAQEGASGSASLDNDGFVRPPLPARKRRQPQNQSGTTESSNNTTQLEMLGQELERVRNESERLRNESRLELERVRSESERLRNESERSRNESKEKEDRLIKESKEKEDRLIKESKEREDRFMKLLEART